MKLRVGLAACALWLAALGCGPGEDLGPAIDVGIVLPFSGALAATGSNIERTIILLADGINQSGGLAGKKIRIAAADTHSDNTRGLAATQTLIDRGVLAVLGPESEDLAKLMYPLLERNDRLFISPGISSPSISSLNDRGLWFRIGPSTALLSTTLAQRIFGDGVRALGILHMNDEYGTGFASILSAAFQSLGGRVTKAAPLELGSATYAEEVRSVLASGATGYALLAYAEPGAIVVNETTSLVSSPAWYFAPPLRSPVFVSNVVATSTSGHGVSSAVDPSSADFITAFRDRWSDVPMRDSFAYYDGLAILLLAYQAAVASGIAAPTAIDVRGFMAEVSRPPGEIIRWNELARGLALVAQGQPVDYQGVSGSVNLSDAGDTPNALVQQWSVNEGVIFDQ